MILVVNKMQLVGKSAHWINREWAGRSDIARTKRQHFIGPTSQSRNRFVPRIEKSREIIENRVSNDANPSWYPSKLPIRNQPNVIWNWSIQNDQLRHYNEFQRNWKCFSGITQNQAQQEKQTNKDNNRAITWEFQQIDCNGSSWTALNHNHELHNGQTNQNWKWSEIESFIKMVRWKCITIENEFPKFEGLMSEGCSTLQFSVANSVRTQRGFTPDSLSQKQWKHHNVATRDMRGIQTQSKIGKTKHWKTKKKKTANKKWREIEHKQKLIISIFIHIHTHIYIYFMYKYKQHW